MKEITVLGLHYTDAVTIGESLFTIFASLALRNSVSDGATNKSVLNIERS